MSVSVADVKALRERTGAGMMDCKKALAECNGDVNQAVEYLQKKSLADAGKRAGKVAAEGLVDSYIHDGRIGVLLEVNSETDFVGRSDDFREMVRNLCMHIAASNPAYITSDEISEEDTAKQTEIFSAQLLEQGKPAAMIEKIMVGKLKKWHSEVCLMNQAYVKDDKITIQQYINSVGARVKEKISVRRYVRFELGEGIEKKVDDFAAEVAATAGL